MSMISFSMDVFPSVVKAAKIFTMAYNRITKSLNDNFKFLSTLFGFVFDINTPPALP